MQYHGKMRTAQQALMPALHGSMCAMAATVTMYAANRTWPNNTACTHAPQHGVCMLADSPNEPHTKQPARVADNLAFARLGLSG